MKSVIRAVPTKNPLHNRGRGVYYEHLETGEKYASLAGGLAWPGLSSPGFTVVVGVRWPVDEMKSPVFITLDEIEDADVRGLLKSCTALREKYSYTWDLWYGCSNHGNMRFVHECNSSHEAAGKRGVFITDSCGIGEQNHFEVLIRTIHELLQTGDDGSKGIIIGSCKALRGHLTNLPPEALFKGSAEFYPAVAALGYVVCSLKAYRPWAHVPGQVFIEQDPFYEAAYGRDMVDNLFNPLDPSGRISTIEREGEI